MCHSEAKSPQTQTLCHSLGATVKMAGGKKCLCRSMQRVMKYKKIHQKRLIMLQTTLKGDTVYSSQLKQFSYITIHNYLQYKILNELSNDRNILKICQVKAVWVQQMGVLHMRFV